MFNWFRKKEPKTTGHEYTNMTGGELRSFLLLAPELNAKDFGTIRVCSDVYVLPDDQQVIGIIQQLSIPAYNKTFSCIHRVLYALVHLLGRGWPVGYLIIGSPIRNHAVIFWVNSQKQVKIYDIEKARYRRSVKTYNGLIP
jgi:hypothetical protein